MTSNLQQTWALRLDRFCAIMGALIPVGLVVGNVGFELMIGLTGLCWLIRCLFVTTNNSSGQLIKHPLILPWTAWFLCIVISLCINNPGGKGWAHDLVFVRYLIFCMAMFDISKRLPVSKYFIYGMMGGVTWALINVVSANVIGYDLLGKPLVRYTSKLKEAARIAGMASYAAPFFLVWGLFDKSLPNKKKNILIGIGVVALFLVLYTHIRTAVLSSLAGIFFSLIYFQRKHLSRAIAISLILAVVCSTFFFFHYKKALNLQSMHDRIYIWKVAWTIWLDHPMAGSSIYAFQDTYSAIAKSGTVAPFVTSKGKKYNPSQGYHAHNIILMLMSCTGIIGLVAFSWLFVNATRLSIRKTNGWRIGLITWPVVFLVIGFTGWSIYDSWYKALFSFFIVLIGSNYWTMKENSDD